MIYLSEWLPNPAGPDAAGEFLELFNNGTSAVSLNGWTVGTEKGKTYSLAGRTIPARGYLVLQKSETKLTLRNTDGGLSLYALGGALADGGHFAGNAPEGKSFSRVNYDRGPAEHFAWAAPTPGAPNKTPVITIVASSYEMGVPLNPQFTAADFFAIMMGTAVLVAGFIHYIVKYHEDLSELFPGGNQKVRRGPRKAREEAENGR